MGKFGDKRVEKIASKIKSGMYEKPSNIIWQLIK